MARQYQPPQQFIAPISGDINQRMQNLADAISRKADANAMPVYAAVGFISPNGTVYMLSVSDTGAFTATPVTPS